MIIRPVTKKDLPAILEIEKASFSSPWHEDHFLYELQKNPYAFVFAAIEENVLIGYVDWWHTFEVGQLNNLAVHPALRGKGIGKMLLIDTLNRMKQAGCQRCVLEVRVHNEVAIHLYEQHGFKKTHMKKQYYENGEDAWAMECII